MFPHVKAQIYGLSCYISCGTQVLALGLFWGKREWLARGARAGAGLGLFGVVVLLGVAGTGTGAVLVLAAAACYAVGALLMHRLFPGAPPLTVTAGMLALAAGPLLVVAAVTEPAPYITARVLLAVIGLGTACTAGAFTAFFAMIRTEGPARAAFITYLAPVAAVAAGALVLSEPVTTRTVAGTVLVLAGAALAARRPAATRTRPSSPPRRRAPAPSMADDSCGTPVAGNGRTSGVR